VCAGLPHAGEFRQSFSTIEYALDFFGEALKLAKNSEAAWFFVINGSRYYLTSAEDKQGYAYRTAQLSAYLAGDMAAHKRLNEGGYEPELPVPQAIRSAILAEVTEVRQRQPAMSSALDAYLRESGFLDR
jgi:hypothetical protein